MTSVAVALAPILASLNPEQAAAATATGRPVLVVAPAGTGKTHVLAARYLVLMNEGVAPSKILAVTFTNKAASEMRMRLDAHIAHYNEDDIHIGTFHSLGHALLRDVAEDHGLPRDFLIASDLECRLLMTEALRSVREPGDDDAALEQRVNALLGLLDRIKNLGHTPGDVALAGYTLDNEILDWEDIAILEAYEAALHGAGRVDFNDLLLMPLKTMRTNAGRARTWAERFRAIIVDEVQDANAVQHEILTKLAHHHRNILLLGDDDQLIYGWRGADPERITRFEDEWPGGQVLNLTTNYRSSPEILERAGQLIANNQIRRPKQFRPALTTKAVVAHQHCETDADELDYIAATIRAETAAGTPPDRIAVLTRYRDAALRYASGLAQRGIACAFPAHDVLDLRATQGLVAWLRLLGSPDDTLAAIGALTLPLTLAPAHRHNLQVLAGQEGTSVVALARAMIKDGRATVNGPIAAWLRKIDVCRDLLRDHQPNTPLPLTAIVTAAGINALIANSDQAQLFDGALDLVQRAYADTGSVAALVDALAINGNSSGPVPADRIAINTMHATKGLEYDIVFAPGWEEGEFPSRRHFGRIEEERRLAYVALTRAKRMFVATTAATRGLRASTRAASPSQFLAELGIASLSY